uniref:ZP domain-containing protein n=1 Tax=Ascaris lumbricoides TaxID=6252 RepID=A0A0M3I0R6_ASCLU
MDRNCDVLSAYEQSNNEFSMAEQVWFYEIFARTLVMCTVGSSAAEKPSQHRLEKPNAEISSELQLLRCGLLAAESVQTGDGRYLVKYNVHCSVKRRPQHHCMVEYIFVIIFVLATIGSIITVFTYFCRSGSREQVDTSSVSSP